MHGILNIKKLVNIFSVCICSLTYPTCEAQALCNIVICGLPGCTVFFPTLSHKQHYFRKKQNFLTHKIFVLSFSTNFDFLYKFCLKHFPLKEELSEIFIMYVYRSSCKVTAIVVRF
jgi:hypothetical protein